MNLRAARTFVGAIALLTVMITGLGASVAGAVPRPAEGASKWDDQVEPIAARVAKLRGLSFDHPVPVRYLADAAFRKRVGNRESKLTKSDRRQVADLQATLRAFGLIDADTDIVESIDAVSGAGVFAYYDPKAKEVVVRGKGALDVNRKATLAHELTHVLQDQHFDIVDLQRAAADSETSSSGALTALIEGDAERIKDAYLRRLSAADRDAYDAEAAKETDSVAAEIESAPALVKIELAAPYVFGPVVLDVLTAHGGNRAVNEALERGAPTDKIYVEPAEALRDPKVTKVSTPEVPKGAHRLGKADEIGAFDLYTLLSSRIDRQVALTAADAWTGDRYVTYRRDGRVCARATIASSKSGASALTAALRAWAGAMPAATVESGPGPRRVTVTSCDTGTIVEPTADQTQGAVRLLANRNAIFASAVRGGASTALAQCVAHQIVKEPILRSSIDSDAEPSPELEQELQGLFGTVASDCRATGRT